MEALGTREDHTRADQGCNGPSRLAVPGLTVLPSPPPSAGAEDVVMAFSRSETEDRRQ